MLRKRQKSPVLDHTDCIVEHGLKRDRTGGRETSQAAVGLIQVRG